MVLALSLAFGAAGGNTRAQPGPTGSLRGVVYDGDLGGPLAQVRATLVEALLTTLTGPDGRFLFERLPPGTYTLTLTRDGYQRQVIPNVVVTAGQLAEVRAGLDSEVVEMEELVVTGQDLLADAQVGLLEIRAEAATIQDSISAETISKAGATDVAGALKFVVGTSVSEGKYATVRGLSDRYTGTTLNGVKVPSADPRRRAVQIDLFPTGTIDSVTVTKTFTPDLQGDFTGGGVDIKTRSIPEGRILSGSYGLEYNTRATGQESFLTYHGGGVRLFGMAGDERDLPREARDPLPAFPAPTSNPTTTGTTSGPLCLTVEGCPKVQDAEAWDRAVRSFDPTIGVSRRTPGANSSFSLVAGNRIDLGGGRAFGVLGALTQTHKYDFYQGGQNNSFNLSEPDQPLVLGAPRVDSLGLEEVLVGFLASAALEAGPNHALGLRLVVNQSAEDEARFQVTGSSSVEQNQGLRYTERRVGSAQLHGRHTFPDAGWKEVRLEWFAAHNLTRQDEPDVRFFRNTYEPGTLSGKTPINSTESQNSRRIFRDIGENGDQAALDLTLPFAGQSGIEGRLKTGAFFDKTRRDYTQRSFYYRFTLPQLGSGSTSTNPALRNDGADANFAKGTFRAAYPGQLWTDVFSEPDRIGLAGNRCALGSNRITNPFTVDCAARNQLLWVLDPLDETDVDYTGNQDVQALYAMADLPLGERLRIIGGARYESTRMDIDPENRFGKVEVIEVQQSGDRGVVLKNQSEARASIDEASILPALAAVFDLGAGMSLRGSWSRTLARPTFRELAPVAAEEFLAGDEFVGNRDLRLSGITNYDLRWEWFRRPGEVLAASVFLKRLRDPIELVSFFAGGRTFVQPVNYPQGEVRGAEVEARIPLGGAGSVLHGLVLGANAGVIHSEVDVPAQEQASLSTFGLDEPTRRLQGQPSYLFNANLSWDFDGIGASGGLFYNVAGDSLLTSASTGDTGGVPNVFMTSFRTLDFSYTQKLVRSKLDLSMTLKAKNLYQSERRTVFRSPDGQEIIKSLRDTAITYGLSFNLKW